MDELKNIFKVGVTLSDITTLATLYCFTCAKDLDCKIRYNQNE